MRVLPAGRRGALVEVDDLAAAMGLHASLRRQPPAGVVELVPAARTVLIVHDGSTSPAQLAAHIQALPADSGAVSRGGGESVEIRVRYDGADLAEVADQTGLSEAEVIRRHAAGEYLVAFSGFAPGFAYLAGGDPALHVSRRDTPRTRVPAGAVALAGEFTGVYPREGPGGWQLIGSTDAALWDLGRDPPALLPPGTPARFVAVQQ
ncbi:MAG: allophanate hydrolase subunit 1 [Actinomycetota bacterium]|nr:allophanate hydrolase subunit 1 [Actinomycetota bacterium]